MTSRMTSFLLLVALVGLVGCQGVKKGKGSRRTVADEEDEVVRHKFPVMHSVDNKEWVEKGYVVVGEMYQVWFEGVFNEWAKNDVDRLVKGGEYYVKVAAVPGEGFGADAFEKSVQISVSVCELVNSAFSEHYQIIFSPHNDDKTTIVGIAPFGAAYTKTRSPALDACTPNMLQTRFEALRTTEGNFYTHSVVILDKPPTRPATFGSNTKDEPIFQQPQNAQAKREQARARAERGEAPDEREQPEKTWFEKYWLYIVIAILILRLQAPPEPQQGGAPAAPAARK